LAKLLPGLESLLFYGRAKGAVVVTRFFFVLLFCCLRLQSAIKVSYLWECGGAQGTNTMRASLRLAVDPYTCLFLLLCGETWWMVTVMRFASLVGVFVILRSA
jgi:hypothetical protein